MVVSGLAAVWLLRLGLVAAWLLVLAGAVTFSLDALRPPGRFGSVTSILQGLAPLTLGVAVLIAAWRGPATGGDLTGTRALVYAGASILLYSGSLHRWPKRQVPRLVLDWATVILGGWAVVAAMA